MIRSAMKVSDIFVSNAEEEIRRELSLTRECLKDKKQEEAIDHLLKAFGAQNEIIKHFWAVLGSASS